VELALVAAGEISEYDSAKIDEIRDRIAANASTPTSAVSVTVTPASVIITATIEAPSSDEAAAITSGLRASLFDPDLASSVLGIAVLGGPHVTASTRVLYSPSMPPSAPGSSEVLFTVFGLEVTRMRLIIGGGGAAALLLLTAAAGYYCCCRTYGAPKKAAAPGISKQASIPSISKQASSTLRGLGRSVGRLVGIESTVTPVVKPYQRGVQDTLIGRAQLGSDRYSAQLRPSNQEYRPDSCSTHADAWEPHAPQEQRRFSKLQSTNL